MSAKKRELGRLLYARCIPGVCSHSDIFGSTLETILRPRGIGRRPWCVFSGERRGRGWWLWVVGRGSSVVGRGVVGRRSWAVVGRQSSTRSSVVGCRPASRWSWVLGRGSWVVGRGRGCWSWVVEAEAAKSAEGAEGRGSWVVGRGSWVVGRGALVVGGCRSSVATRLSVVGCRSWVAGRRRGRRSSVVGRVGRGRGSWWSWVVGCGSRVVRSVSRSTLVPWQPQVS